MRKCQFSSQPMKDERKFKHPLQLNELWFFWDKKNFRQYQVVNSQNSQWLSLFPQDVLILIKIKHPVHIMVFEVITSDGDFISPFIFSHGLTLNTEVYIKCLKEIVLSWIESSCWKTLHGFCTMPHKQQKQVLSVRKLLWQHHPKHLAT